ncbi:hypothetical protein ACRARE_04830 [Pseudooceanicola sp. 200-1SW]
MNSLAVVLAADSATTVEYNGKNGQERRYFKGANKIFQLSKHQPVGLMLYNTASLLRVPWEVIVKEFRKDLGDRSFNSVRQYAEEFISFVEGSTTFFPLDERKKAFDEALIDQIIALLVSLREGDVGEITIDDDVINEYFADLPSDENLPLDRNYLDDLWQRSEDMVLHLIEEWTANLGFKRECDKNSLANLIFRGALHTQCADDNYTGFVFAGFGEHSVFPEMTSLKRCRIVGERFLVSEEEDINVSREVPAVIEGFAQTSMVDTFTLGISFEVFASLQRIIAEEFGLLIRELQDRKAALPNDDELGLLLRSRIDSFTSKMFDYTRDDHNGPLRRVLGVLPVDEMAELAETLINLQSLKEKVTKPSETVGGPVDVAAITRSEGLVWIRRKHYFDAEINSRYFTRQG